jgi:hypothetical protein
MYSSFQNRSAKIGLCALGKYVTGRAFPFLDRMYLLFTKHLPQEPRNGFVNYCHSFVNIHMHLIFVMVKKITLTSICNLNWSLLRQLKKTMKANRHHNLCLEEFCVY